MKYSKIYLLGVLFLFAQILITACEPSPQSPKDYSDHDNFTVKLSAENSPGYGQYHKKVQSGYSINVNVNIQSEAELKELKIIKTTNTEVDSSFSTNGSKEVEVSGTSYDYEFNYTPKVSDIDELIGFTFKVTNADGETEASDLTLDVNLSPRDNFTRVEWDLTSILHVNTDNEEVFKECNEGYALTFSADSTMSKVYGENACGLDALSAYDSWHFKDDANKLVLKKHNVFDPSSTKTEIFKIEELTTDELKLRQTIDLSELGQGIETFLYIYEATPK